MLVVGVRGIRVAEFSERERARGIPDVARLF